MNPGGLRGRRQAWQWSSATSILTSICTGAMASSAWMEATASEGLDQRSRDESGTREELGAVELGERDGDGAGALAEAGGAALVGLHAGEAAGEAGAARALVLPRLLPALLARGTLLPAAAGAVGGGGAGGVE